MVGQAPLGAACLLAVAACGDDAGRAADAGVDASTVGTSCALAACPDGYACVKLTEGDPNAYCTTSCSTDTACPPSFFCGDDGGGSRCLRRSFCSPCTTDDQCRTVLVPDGVCQDGACSKVCDPAGQTCPSGFACDVTTLACVHGSGSCASDGTTCDPCVIDADCAQTGGICFRYLSSGEQLCAEPCNAQNPCAGPYQCDIPPGMLDGYCVPPATYGDTCYPEAS